MKYEYQDIIIEELLKQKENEIDKSTLKTAKFNVFHYEFGEYEPNKSFYCDKRSFVLHLHIANGSVEGVYDKQGSEYSIDFTVYEVDYPAKHKNHILCHLDII